MKKDFHRFQAPTSGHPLGMEVSRAEGCYIYDVEGKAHLDFVAGVSACSLGHCHPEVVKAIRLQAGSYMHVMVYGEYVQAPAVEFCRELASLLPPPLDMTYLVNSGTEAIEGALKLARRYTGRPGIVAARNSYHGNTMGSMSVSGYERRKAAFRPLLTGVDFIDFNREEQLERIDGRTAAVILETIQGGAGFITPKGDYLRKVRDRCDEMGALLILDEIQPGFGRTGKLFAFEHYGVVPDILVMGKGMCSGLPAGAFTASSELMKSLSFQPELGHITTFGGNPVIAAAARATLRLTSSRGLLLAMKEKERLFRQALSHPLIEEIRGKGLMLCLICRDAETANRLVLEAAKKRLILFWLLFEKRAVRITPPLTIHKHQILEGCQQIIEILDGFVELHRASQSDRQ